jgi:hypothetical protein
MKSKFRSVLPGLLILLAASCTKVQVLPVVPHITFTDFRIYDTIDMLGNSVKGGTLNFRFEDGDGDIGLQPPTTSQTDSINLFMTLYRQRNGTVSPAPVNDPFKPTGFRIPYMERPGQNKILKGTIEVDFTYLFYSDQDTIKYNFFIKDRAGHVSNTDSTSLIPVAVDGTYKR